MPAGAGLAPAALARRLLGEGARADAEAVVARLVADAFGMDVRRASISADWTSLNSVNGIVETADGTRCFFKFHQEEGEEAAVREYYRAELLERAGLPVDRPLKVCRTPGHQILLYAFRDDRSLAEACLALERAGGNGARGGDARAAHEDVVRIVALQRELDRATADVYLATLHASDPGRCEAEAIHQLFHRRLWTPSERGRLGGRVAQFYAGRRFALPGLELGWDELARLRWRVNGVDYRRSLGELFAESLALLDPARLAASGAVTAHGDAHNANVWLEQRGERARLVLFDPAFAGEHVPALLADVKATFHNVFAHPRWLYHPAEADARCRVRVTREGERLVVEHDWKLTPLRNAFLEAKIGLVWRPLLRELKARGWLPSDWRRALRCALFCCPTLVMSLRAGAAHGATAGRSPAVSALSFAIAVMAGSEAEGREDAFGRFVGAVEP